jgi:hypothetical protein
LRDAGAMKAEAVARHMAARRILEADIVGALWRTRCGPRYSDAHAKRAV